MIYQCHNVYSGKKEPTNIFFFFQAEDGIRDYKVTGVQTCALPISAPWLRLQPDLRPRSGLVMRMGHNWRRVVRPLRMLGYLWAAPTTLACLVVFLLPMW